MALVVFLRGVNVGGHRTFRPTALAAGLKHLEAVNVGAAGTFVIRRPVSRAGLRAEIASRLPFDAEMAICDGRDIARLVSGHFFAGHRPRPDVVRFVSVLTRRPRSSPELPIDLPSRSKWLLRALALDGRFVVGVYRRRMEALRCLGQLDGLFGVPVTTRNWNTMSAIARLLAEGGAARPRK